MSFIPMLCNRIGLGLMLWLISVASAQAEPYLAVHSGHKCMTCHVNPSGGGLRTPFGRLYAKSELAANSYGKPDHPLSSPLANYLALGSDLRSNLIYRSTPGSPDELAFDLQSMQLYLNVELIPGQLSLYLDEHVAPDGAINREAYTLFWFDERKLYLKAGRLFLPYGIRLEDDSAFIREVTGINFNSIDEGIEIGLEIDAWSVNLAITNGTSGGDETNRKKQISLRSVLVKPKWRAGASFNINEGASHERRQMFNLFTGLKTGPVAWLAEVDILHDEEPGIATIKQRVAFLEGNYALTRGHNLKLTFEHHDPNIEVRDNERRRVSLLWEHTPIEYIQIRTGYRQYTTRSNNPSDEQKVLFVQLHSFF